MAVDDEKYMRQALELAGLAEGETAPNPLVGCVVLDASGRVVGTGYHPKAGASHAEVFALDQAGEAARGGTLYCTLEPCCHFGRTPPCSARVIASGVKRVVVGIGDPNPKVAGGGLEAIRQAGIIVEVGVLAKECRYQNRGFLKTVTEQLPWLALKMAISLDGKIADRDGGSRYISGAESRQKVMQLRSQFDAVLIGAGTARIDDPSLTVRLSDAKNRANKTHQPIKIIVDSNLSLPPTAKVFSGTAGDIVQTYVLTLADSPAKQHQAEQYPAHVEFIYVPAQPASQGQSGLSMRQALELLKERGLTRILCEGGSHLAGSLLDQNLVDELYWFVAPKILGDSQSLPAVSSPLPRLIASVSNFTVLEQLVLGEDVLIHALINTP